MEKNPSFKEIVKLERDRKKLEKENFWLEQKLGNLEFHNNHALSTAFNNLCHSNKQIECRNMKTRDIIIKKDFFYKKLNWQNFLRKRNKEQKMQSLDRRNKRISEIMEFKQSRFSEAMKFKEHYNKVKEEQHQQEKTRSRKNFYIKKMVNCEKKEDKKRELREKMEERITTRGDVRENKRRKKSGGSKVKKE